jgi:GNAT superfamily N-acetyltransferase
VNIRTYTPADHDAFVSATAQLQDYIAALDDLNQERSGANFDSRAYADWSIKAAGPNGLVLIAEEEEKLIGYLVATLRETSKRDEIECFPSKEAEVLELFVHEDSRKKKVGLALMQAAEEHFRSIGCTALLVDCFAPNHSAHVFYERYGFTDRLLTMRKEL